MVLTDGYIAKSGTPNGPWLYSNCGSQPTGELERGDEQADAWIRVQRFDAGAIPGTKVSVNGAVSAGPTVDFSSLDGLLSAVPEAPGPPFVAWAGVNPMSLCEALIVWNTPIVVLDTAKILGGTVTAVSGRLMVVELGAPISIDGEEVRNITVETGAVGVYLNDQAELCATDFPDAVAVGGGTLPPLPPPGPIEGCPCHPGPIISNQDAPGADNPTGWYSDGEIWCDACNPNAQCEPPEGDVSGTFIAVDGFVVPVRCTHPFMLVSVHNCGCTEVCCKHLDGEGVPPQAEIWEVAMRLYGGTLPGEVFALDQLVDVDVCDFSAGSSYYGELKEDVECCDTATVLIYGIMGGPAALFDNPIEVQGEWDISNELPGYAGQAVEWVPACYQDPCLECDDQVPCVALVRSKNAEAHVVEDIIKPIERTIPVSFFDEVAVSAVTVNLPTTVIDTTVDIITSCSADNIDIVTDVNFGTDNMEFLVPGVGQFTYLTEVVINTAVCPVTGVSNVVTSEIPVLTGVSGGIVNTTFACDAVANLVTQKAAVVEDVVANIDKIQVTLLNSAELTDVVFLQQPAGFELDGVASTFNGDVVVSIITQYEDCVLTVPNIQGAPSDSNFKFLGPELAAGVISTFDSLFVDNVDLDLFQDEITEVTEVGSLPITVVTDAGVSAITSVHSAPYVTDVLLNLTNVPITIITTLATSAVEVLQTGPYSAVGAVGYGPVTEISSPVFSPGRLIPTTFNALVTDIGVVSDVFLGTGTLDLIYWDNIDQFVLGGVVVGGASTLRTAVEACSTTSLSLLDQMGSLSVISTVFASSTQINEIVTYFTASINGTAVITSIQTAARDVLTAIFSSTHPIAQYTFVTDCGTGDFDFVVNLQTETIATASAGLVQGPTGPFTAAVDPGIAILAGTSTFVLANDTRAVQVVTTVNTVPMLTIGATVINEFGTDIGQAVTAGNLSILNDIAVSAIDLQPVGETAVAMVTNVGVNPVNVLTSVSELLTLGPAITSLWTTLFPTYDLELVTKNFGALSVQSIEDNILTSIQLEAFKQEALIGIPRSAQTELISMVTNVSINDPKIDVITELNWEDCPAITSISTDNVGGQTITVTEFDTEVCPAITELNVTTGTSQEDKYEIESVIYLTEASSSVTNMNVVTDCGNEEVEFKFNEGDEPVEVVIFDEAGDVTLLTSTDPGCSVKYKFLNHDCDPVQYTDPTYVPDCCDGSNLSAAIFDHPAEVNCLNLLMLRGKYVFKPPSPTATRCPCYDGQPEIEQNEPDPDNMQEPPPDEGGDAIVPCTLRVNRLQRNWCKKCF